jgi:prepilin-type N-terminal cleavage/methylation domain-containing protein
MKPMKTGMQTTSGRLPVEQKSITSPACSCSIANRQSPIANAFTLVELLAVITIIAVIAAFTVPVLRTVKIHQYESTTQAEMAQLETAIDSYHSVYGVYPPDNPGNSMTNQLYYELVGTTNNGTSFTTLDGASTIPVTEVSSAFANVAGFVNCSKPGAGGETPAGRNFIHDLKPNQLSTITNVGSGLSYTILTASVGGPDASYEPIGIQNVNPWRYNSSSPTNNPGRYDLWVQLSIGSSFNSSDLMLKQSTYLICNWTKQTQVNNPLP